MILEWQILKECIPGPLMSDEAARHYRDRLVDLAIKVGPVRFHEVIVTLIDTCDRRPTIGMFRKVAGVNNRLDPFAETVALAWNLVTNVVARHIKRDGNGNAILMSHTTVVRGRVEDTPVPSIPGGITQAVKSMGGWTALADSYPQYWGQRFHNFKELLRLTSDEAAALAESAKPVDALK